jgi:hypothetical protein
MKRAARPRAEEEPVGIVISSGARAERLPVVWAYVWGLAPDFPQDSEGDA